MPYNTKIVPENGNYVGYVLKHDEPVFNTKPCKTATQASAELQKFLEHKPNLDLGIKTNRTLSNSQSSSVEFPRQRSTNISTRRCCGRG